jgi:hypothetical protein
MQLDSPDLGSYLDAPALREFRQRPEVRFTRMWKLALCGAREERHRSIEPDAEFASARRATPVAAILRQ